MDISIINYPNILANMLKIIYPKKLSCSLASLQRENSKRVLLSKVASVRVSIQLATARPSNSFFLKWSEKEGDDKTRTDMIQLFLSWATVICTGRMGWMSHRKWKEIKQQPSMLVQLLEVAVISQGVKFLPCAYRSNF